MVVLEHATLYGGQSRQGVLAVASHHVERYLGVEYFLGQLLEGKQIYGLLVKLVHSLLPVFRCRLEYRGYYPLHRRSFLHSQQQQGQDHGGGMSHDRGRGLQLQGDFTSASGSSSKAYERSTIVLPAFCAFFQFWRVHS